MWLPKSIAKLLFTYLSIPCVVILLQPHSTVHRHDDEKNELTLKEFSSIRMKILNDIACNLNSIEIEIPKLNGQNYCWVV
jgi:hypothetical protein